jgi:N-acetylglutamate synthase-like GNAT family acetyltransferase
MFELLLLLFFLHWFGDFVCQTRWMADNKSKNVKALTLHVLTYTLVLFVGLALFVPTQGLLYFAALNFVLHWLTDITTSQITRYFWAKKDIHKFFATIGFDQFIHSACLLYTARAFLL